MKIGIYTFRSEGCPQWDPDSIRSGITGSEEAVIYMAKELANLGHIVQVFADVPSGSVHAKEGANPRYVSLEAAESQQFDIAICWRWPGIGSFLKEKRLAKKVYLWPHDTLEGIASSEGFDDVLWLSEWQREQWISTVPSFARFTKIFGNGIELKQVPPLSPRENPYSCIYGSNYGRGLVFLLHIWPHLKKRFPQATLDIYYGWQHWGLLTPFEERWAREALERLPGVKEHGLVGHEELNCAYAKASFWTYPCIKPETFCITALRAQQSGAVPVILEGSALKHTVRSGYKCQKLEEYLPLLLRAMDSAEKISLKERALLGKAVEKYTWQGLALQWNALFNAKSL